ncbi:MAG: polysaccharide biosynthesis C-terminal domain-containing protein [Gaiella sp.]|nr:polysaccharide biosynthesis C-terminal domain-containing protein [Gaiella sp.]
MIRAAAHDGTTSSTHVGGSIVRGGAWQSTSRILGQAFTLTVSIVAARQLGAAGMGRLVFITYVYTTLSVLLSAGVPVAVNRFTAELIGRGHDEAIGALYRWARRVGAAAAALGAGILVSVYLAGGEPGKAWLAASVACSAAVLQTIPYAVLLGAQQWRSASLVGLASAAIGTGAKLLLLAAGHGIPALVTVDACIALANMAGASLLARRVIPPGRPPALPRDLARRVGTYAAASSAAVILGLVVLQRSEIIFLQRFADDVEVAIYSIPFSAVVMLNIFPATLGIAAASAFATLFGAGAYDRMRSGFGRAVRLTLLVALPLTAAAITLGPDALLLAYGEAYSGTGRVLVVLLLAFPVFSLMAISTSVVQGFGRQRAPLISLGAATVVALALDLALIPPFGSLGAAIANAVSQAVAAGLLVVYAGRLVGGLEWERRSLARLIVVSVGASLVTLIPVLALGTLTGLVVGGTVFVASFLALGVALQVVPARDASWLDEVLRDRFGPRAGRLVRAFSAPVEGATARP